MQNTILVIVVTLAGIYTTLVKRQIQYAER